MWKKNILFVASLFFLSFFLKGCFVLRIFDFGPSIDLGKHSWIIESFVLGDQTYISKDYGVMPTMRFDTTDFKVYGNTGCNVFFANYDWLNNDVIEMRGSGMTRKMCSKEALAFEQKLMEEFDGDFEVKEEEKKLILIRDGLIIHLEAQEGEKDGDKS